MRPPLNKRCRTCGYRFEADRDACPTDGTALGRPRPGVEFLGPYRLVERLGAGGMGAIYRAIYEKAGRSVAIKLLHRSMRREVVALSRFFEEARAVNTIRHPNVVELYDLSGEGEDVYMVLELLRGQDLRDALQDAPVGFGPERTVRIVEQVCGALQAAHAKKIVHRDLKPENVYLVSRENGSEQVKLLDFGIAKLEREGRLTTEGVALGTPEYMSPEQARGGEVDARADIYSVGCIAFEMLTGQTPFAAPSAAEVMTRQVRDAPRSPRELNPDVPEPLAAAVLRCLAKAPKGRFSTALDTAQAFTAAIGSPFDASGAFRNWKTWDSPSGNISVDLPALAVPGWFARLAARIRDAF